MSAILSILGAWGSSRHMFKTGKGRNCIYATHQLAFIRKIKSFPRITSPFPIHLIHWPNVGHLAIPNHKSESQSCLTFCNPMDCSLPGSSVHGDSPGKNTGVGSLALLQGIFPTQGLNLGLPYCRWIFYHLSHQGNSPLTKETGKMENRIVM